MDFVDGKFQMRQSGHRDTTEDDKEEKTDSTKTHDDSNMVTEASNENSIEK